MVGRLGVTAAVWLVGSLFIFILDGQHFTHALEVLGCALLGAVPWVPVVLHREGGSRRFVAFAVLGLSALVIVRVSLHLPGAYEAQRKFNERRATPNHG
jgi:hypothetical protein